MLPSAFYEEGARAQTCTASHTTRLINAFNIVPYSYSRSIVLGIYSAYRTQNDKLKARILL
jgi:hypothetical protein